MAISWLKIENLGIKKWISDDTARGAGTLAFHKTEAGTLKAYFRCKHEGKRQDILVGNLDKSGKNGLTLVDARIKAGELSKIYREITTDVKSYLTLQATQKQQSFQNQIAEATKADSLIDLLNAYVANLCNEKKTSAHDVQRAINFHVANHPIAKLKAKDVKSSDISDLLRPILSEGKSNTADKLRAYINAAYNLALTADSNPKLGLEFQDFYDLPYNPCDKIKKLHSHSVLNERPVLSIIELRHYLKHLYAMKASAHRDLLIISLLCAGQRPLQLSKCLQADVNFHDKFFTQKDEKGRRSDARLHVLPITEPIYELLKNRYRLSQALSSSWLFTNTGAQISSKTPGDCCSKISKKMIDLGETTRHFDLHDIRRACETHLARLRVSKEIRNQLLSHGITGVDSKHYDRHDYDAEKKTALLTWQKELLDKDSFT
jgi:integrase